MTNLCKALLSAPACHIICSYYTSYSCPLRGNFCFPTGAHYIPPSSFFRALCPWLQGHGLVFAFAFFFFQLITFWQRFCSLYVLAPSVCILGNIYCLSDLPAPGLLTIPWEQWGMMCQNLPASQHSPFTTRTPWASEQTDYYDLYLSGLYPAVPYLPNWVIVHSVGPLSA